MRGGGVNSSSNSNNDANVLASYIADASVHSDGYSYEIVKFYKDNTFSVSHVEHNQDSEDGMFISFDVDCIELSGRYEGDPTKKSTTITIYGTKQIEPTFMAKYLDYIADPNKYSVSGTSASLKITSNDFSYNEISTTETLTIADYEATRGSSTYQNTKKPVQILGTGYSALELKWTNLKGATEYTVYYSEENDSSKAQELGTKKASSSYYDTTFYYTLPSDALVKGKTYYFWVKAKLVTGNESDLSTSYCVKNVSISAPSISITSDEIYINSVYGATSYKIYRSTTNDASTATYIGSKDTYGYYKDSTVSSQGTYYYWVTAVKNDEESNFSNGVSYEYKLPKVSIKSASSNGVTINIKWDLINYSDSYYVYYNTTNDFDTATKASDTVKPTTNAEEGSYTYLEPVLGTRYYFWVQPVPKASGVTYEHSDVKAVKCTSLTAPSFSLYDNGDNRTEVYISYGAGATSYKIYRNTTDDFATATCVSTSATTSSNYDSITESGKYYYWVTAVKGADESDYSSSKNVTITYSAITAPSNLNVSFSNGRINLTWTAPSVGTAVSYDVYIGTTSYGNFTKIKTVTTNSAVISAEDNPTGSTILKSTGTRYFKVKSKNADGLESDFCYNASCSYTYYPILPPATVTATLSDNGFVTLSWDSVSNARYYKVYYYISSFSTNSVNDYSWELLQDTVLSTSYTVPAGKITSQNYYYTFAIKAFNANDEGSAYSKKSDNIKLNIAAPTNLQANSSNGSINLTWTAPFGGTAVSYDIYISSSSSGSYTKIKTVTTNSATISDGDSNILRSTGYKYFKIKAKNAAGLESDFSNYTYCNYTFNAEAYALDLSTETMSSTNLKSCRLESGTDADYYKFQVQAGKKYAVKWNDNYQSDKTPEPTLDVKVTAYYSGNSNNPIFSNVDSGSTTPKTFTSEINGWVIIKVIPYSSGKTGTYELGIYEIN